MKKISAFDLTRLRIEEDFAFHQRVQQYAEVPKVCRKHRLLS